MIILKKVRLINWYGFSNVTAPIGLFTLIAGKNGNGKSVMLDAIKYAAFGDTIFNKSSENKGSRTLSSYTRGLLDATAGTYMRPADKACCGHQGRAGLARKMDWHRRGHYGLPSL